MQRWKDKVAVVTGASAGIGRAVAAKLAEEGMRVVAVARRREKLQELANQYKGRIYPLPCDITNDQELVNLFKNIEEKIGPCHVLVNNAGAAYKASLLESNLKDWRYMFDLNVIALGVATQEAISLMKKNQIDSGYVINISSIASLGIPGKEWTERYVYNATKHAVRIITEGARMELAQQKSGIKISTICPGVVESEIFDVGGWCNVYKENPYLPASAIAGAVVTLLSSPCSTHIAEIVVRPLGEQIYC
ncbi:dehydrogenase/reductase SDR family member 11 isoform X3 [Halyomorpha halys]|uniref:dehydrogenase/reductase SDR family member 11 isoform X3 n=1 Tax=Halyomorpha halys TaxID=286706 RepID=UPI0034D1B20D